ncbi:SIR2 family protein [Janthinobacterium svalbardensis]|uniref:SIR2 family protein n=1 Tax=Janthinobacterium svalbardensis TaxID=368607 RepID=UPI002FCDC846
MDIEQRLTETFKRKGAGPFLFVGSGFSRRYLALEDWKGLLSRFCVMGKPFEFYLSSSDGSYPMAAKIIAQDFNTYWWSASEYAESVAANSGKIVDSTSALRIEICRYLSTLGAKNSKDSPYQNEIALLSGLNVDGIITTNWDPFLEQLFPDYKKYIGQNELLFSNPQEVGEIYKIHGCSTKPGSLILTSEDYFDFNNKNPYLAAKLITIFVEHPIVFLGYSISDENIASLLRSISMCIGKDNIEKLRQNLIFVQRLSESEQPSVSDTYLTIDGIQIPLILVKTNDYSEIYRALAATKRKIPARILRYCKEQMFELVNSSNPETKLAVIDIDSVQDKDNLEFVVGVGVKALAGGEIGAVGYDTIEVPDLIHDLLYDDKNYDPDGIVNSVVKRVGRYTSYVPVFKYLHAMKIHTREQYDASGYELEKWVDLDLAKLRLKTYAGIARGKRHQSIQEIIASCTPENAAAVIPFLPEEKIDIEAIKEFLILHEDKVDPDISNYASHFKKLAVIYDRLKWGWL